MAKLAERADSLEKLLGSVITMLGKVNEKTTELNIRLTKVEHQIEKQLKQQKETVNFYN